jgi:hypothetical protein
MVNKSPLERLAPLSGVVSVVMMIAGALVFGFAEYLPTAADVSEYFNSNPTQVALGGYVGALSAFLLLWFSGSLRSALRQHEGGDGRLSELAFAGGIASSVVMAVGFTLLSVAGQRAGTSGGISADAAVTLYDLSSAIQGTVFAIFLAVMMGATGLASLRTGAFPAWFGWLSLVIALALLSPYAYIALFPALVWLIVVSIWLYARGASAESS